MIWFELTPEIPVIGQEAIKAVGIFFKTGRSVTRALANTYRVRNARPRLPYRTVQQLASEYAGAVPNSFRIPRTVDLFSGRERDPTQT
jgi:hypothetical protein